MAIGVSTGPIPPGVASHGVNVTKSDTTVYSPPLTALWISGAGDLVVTMAGDATTTTLTAVGAKTFLPNLAVTQVMAATTATNITGFY